MRVALLPPELLLVVVLLVPKLLLLVAVVVPDLLVVVLLVAAGVPAGSHFVLVLSMVTFATTVASGADYLARFARQAWHLPAR